MKTNIKLAPSIICDNIVESFTQADACVYSKADFLSKTDILNNLPITRRQAPLKPRLPLMTSYENVMKTNCQKGAKQ